MEEEINGLAKQFRMHFLYFRERKADSQLDMQLPKVIKFNPISTGVLTHIVTFKFY